VQSTSAQLLRRGRVGRHWFPVLREATLLWLGTRLVLAVATYLAILFAQAGQPSKVIGIHELLDAWNHWDSSFFYLPIAVRGYRDGIQTGFFPLYPALVHGVWALTGQRDVLVVGLAVSSAASLFAFAAVGLFALAEDASPSVVLTTLRLVAVSPFAFFLAAPYPMSLLLALAAVALLAARCGWWYLAAPAVALASLTHPAGCLLALPVTWEFAAQHGWGRNARHWVDRLARVVYRLRTGRLRWHLPIPPVQGPRAAPSVPQYVWLRQHLPRGPSILQAILVLEAAPAALWGYMIYCARTFHDPLAFAHHQAVDFQHLTVGPWTGLTLLIANVRAMPAWTYEQARVLVDVVPLMVALVLTGYAAARRALPVSFLLYSASIPLLLLCQPVVGTNFYDVVIGAGRYLLAAVPLYVLLARWCVMRPWLGTLLLYGCALLQTLLAVFYLTGNWLV
jgi:hypothetical protein